MRTAINAIIINDRKILLVKKKLTLILPGGKPEKNESDLDCLIREVKEELSGTELKNFKYYKEFEGITPYKKDILKAKTYFADIRGGINHPSSEILEYFYISFNDLINYNISDITSKIIYSLKKENYL